MARAEKFAPRPPPNRCTTPLPTQHGAPKHAIRVWWLKPGGWVCGAFLPRDQPLHCMCGGEACGTLGARHLLVGHQKTTRPPPLGPQKSNARSKQPKFRLPNNWISQIRRFFPKGAIEVHKADQAHAAQRAEHRNELNDRLSPSPLVGIRFVHVETHPAPHTCSGVHMGPVGTSIN